MTHSFFNWSGPRQIRAIAWSLDGKYITIGDDSESIEVRNAATGERLIRRHASGKVETVVWSPNGRLVAAGSIGEVNGKNQNYSVQVWDWRAGDDLFEKDLVISRDIREEGKGLVSIRWLPDSKCMEFVRMDRVVEVWDTTTHQLLSAQRYKDGAGKIHAVAWSPNGKYVAAIMLGQAIEVWRATTGSVLCTYRGHIEQVKCLAWSPDSRFLASYDAAGTMQLWDAAKGTLRFTYSGLPRGAGICAWSPEGKRIAIVISNDRIRVFQLE